MKVLFGNNKLRTGVIATLVGVAILLTGLTYAYFSSRGSADVGNVTVGSLRVVATLEDTDDAVMGPGYTQDGLIGSIQNKGTLEAITKIDFGYNITIKSDGNGDPLDPTDYYPAPADQQFIKVRLLEEGYESPVDPDRYTHELGMWINAENGNSYVWTNGADGNTYIIMVGGDVLHFAYEIVVEGDAPFDYMDADIAITLDYVASQLIPDAAVMETFGIADIDSFLDYDYYDGFVIFDPAGDGTTIRPFMVTDPVSMAIAKISQMQDSSIKAQLLEIFTNL